MGVYYTLNKDNDCEFQYPEDMEKILSYLESHGTIKCSHSKIDALYHDFSEECYSAGWMDPSDELIEEFARWLDNRND